MNFGMKMNVDQTKTMLVSRRDVRPHAKIRIDRQLIEEASRFTYLGQLITADGKYEEEMKRRIGQARSAYVI